MGNINFTSAQSVAINPKARETLYGFDQISCCLTCSLRGGSRCLINHLIDQLSSSWVIRLHVRNFGLELFPHGCWQRCIENCCELILIWLEKYFTRCGKNRDFCDIKLNISAAWTDHAVCTFQTSTAPDDFFLSLLLTHNRTYFVNIEKAAHLSEFSLLELSLDVTDKCVPCWHLVWTLHILAGQLIHSVWASESGTVWQIEKCVS